MLLTYNDEYNIKMRGIFNKNIYITFISACENKYNDCIEPDIMHKLSQIVRTVIAKSVYFIIYIGSIVCLIDLRKMETKL